MGPNDLLTNAERERGVTSVMGTVTVCALCNRAPVVYRDYCHRCREDLRRPTRALPGSWEKQALLMHRIAAGLPLWVDGDLSGDDLIIGDFIARPHLGEYNGD